MFKKYSPEQTAQRWKELAELTKFKTALNEGGSLLYTVTAPNGVTYSIVKENANYFIKHTNVLKEAYNVNDFKYMGTMDKMLEKHSAFSMAKKRLEGLMHQIKEDMKYNLLLEEMNQDDKKLLNDFEEVDKETPEEKESVETTTTPEEIDAIEPEIPMGDEEETNGDLDSELDASSEEIPMGDETEEEHIDDKTQVDSERDEDGSPEKIQSLLGKLQNQINNLPEMSPALTKNILNTIITSTKEGIMKLDDNEKDDLIKRIEKDGEKLDEEDIVLEIEIPETKNNFQKLEELIQKKLEEKKAVKKEDPLNIVQEIVKESMDLFLNKSKKR